MLESDGEQEATGVRKFLLDARL